MRTAWALILAPIAPIAVAVPVEFVTGIPFAALTMFTCVFVGYPAMLILGIPTLHLARKNHWLRFWQVVCASALIGAVVAIAATAPVLLAMVGGPGMGSVLPPFAAYAAVGAMFGSISGSVFWALAIGEGELRLGDPPE